MDFNDRYVLLRVQYAVILRKYLYAFRDPFISNFLTSDSIAICIDNPSIDIATAICGIIADAVIHGNQIEAATIKNWNEKMSLCMCV